jgi:hypothetical protein
MKFDSKTTAWVGRRTQAIMTGNASEPGLEKPPKPAQQRQARKRGGAGSAPSAGYAAAGHQPGASEGSGK